jgi:predicted RNase H-like HicB family nuclease
VSGRYFVRRPAEAATDWRKAAKLPDEKMLETLAGGRKDRQATKSASCCWLTVLIKPTSLQPELKLDIDGVLMNIKVIVEPGEDGYFVAHVPSLKSCWSQGKTREEALENIREAIDLYLEPEPTELAENQEIVELTV